MDKVPKRSKRRHPVKPEAIAEDAAPAKAGRNRKLPRDDLPKPAVSAVAAARNGSGGASRPRKRGTRSLTIDTADTPGPAQSKSVSIPGPDSLSSMTPTAALVNSMANYVLDSPAMNTRRNSSAGIFHILSPCLAALISDLST
jgi:hypothetical protein